VQYTLERAMYIHRSHSSRYLAPVLVMILIWGCRSAPQQTWTRTELCFGLSKPDRTIIADAEWQSFIDQQIVPRFPAGFTVVPAEGRWFQDGQTRVEPSRIVIILHPKTHQTNAMIDEIAREYARRFNQDAVLRADGVSNVTFVEK
jgi:Protein of unknown function (DUF3574)